MILLDTCVISEVLKPEPDPRVMAWFETLDEENVYIPVLVLGELGRGIALLDAGRKRDALELWLEQLEQRFASKIVNWDLKTARTWARMHAECQKNGRVLPLTDSMIAATAHVSSALLATRNTQDYEGSGVICINPWL